MEKIYNERLIWYLETTNIFTEEKRGFRRNHSTLDTLLRLHTDISNAKNNKQHLCLISLYLEKAYDIAILKIIQKVNINGKMFLFLKNVLSIRTIQIKAHSTLPNIYQKENGIPQRLVISVTMFLIAIKNIL